MEAEIGPLIPFWCESTFTAEKLSPSFSGFNQNVPFFTPPPPKKNQKLNSKRVDTNKEKGNFFFFLSAVHNSEHICQII